MTAAPTATTPIQFLKGVGPKLATILQAKGIHTVEDLVLTFPRAYEDQRAVRTVSEFQENETTVATVQVVNVHYRRLRGRRGMLEWTCADETGPLKIAFFHMIPNVHMAIKSGAKIRVIGKPTLRGRTWQMVHPQFRVIQDELSPVTDAVISPVYPEVAPLSQFKWRKLVEAALEKIELRDDLFPPALLQKLGLPYLEDAVRFLHKPPQDADISLLQEQLHPMFLRFVFEELFLYEFGICSNHDRQVKVPSYKIPQESKLAKQLLETLPFKLTGDQIKVIDQISFAMSRGDRVYSLVQGDVGSGKTIVAVLLALRAIEAGHQVALMAPTELLAEQHFNNLKALLKNMPIEMDLLTGSLSNKQREIVLENMSSGRTHLTVGTHALIQSGVEMPRLGLIVIDEQHRFGVEQRLKLSQKGLHPHQVHMTATPIPRTLALTLFGDMDVHTIREKPAGRIPIRTKWVGQPRREKVFDFMKEQCTKGAQAYVVFPLIDESEVLELKNATEEFEKLKERFPELSFELLHGRMDPAERDSTMRRFRDGKIQILVSTTVIEVGVDVPRATLMIIENAERFGLSQLHQLRGRVGRGSEESWCILVSGYAISNDGEARLRIMEETTDGFEIAERDLQMRGPGEFFGSRQSGLPSFRYADLLKHQDILVRARELARKVLDENQEHVVTSIMERVKKFYGGKVAFLEA